MLPLLVFLILGQIEVAEGVHPTVDTYLNDAYKLKSNRIAGERGQVKDPPKTTKFAVAKKIKEENRQKLKELDRRENDKADVPDVPLRAASMKIGDYGVLVDGASVVQVLGDDRLLCKHGGLFVVRGIDTSKIVDKQTISLSGIFVVAGKYRYENLVGGTNTVPLVEPWKNEAALKERLKQIREEAMKVAEKAATAKTPKTGNK